MEKIKNFREQLGQFGFISKEEVDDVEEKFNKAAKLEWSQKYG